MDKNKAQFYEKVFDLFRKNNPLPETELKYEHPFQLLIAVVLSAQCTDVRVNQITNKLFKHYPTVFDMYKATQNDIYNIIKSCSYPNSKTKYILSIVKILVEKYNGIVPDNFNELTKLPGVGRKTANVLLSVLYKKPVLAVDTHVFRVAQRIGLAEPTNSFLQVEKQLCKYIKPNDIPIAHHWLILHGRYICKARKPLCNNCFLKQLCHYFNKS